MKGSGKPHAAEPGELLGLRRATPPISGCVLIAGYSSSHVYLPYKGSAWFDAADPPANANITN